MFLIQKYGTAFDDRILVTLAHVLINNLNFWCILDVDRFLLHVRSANPIAMSRFQPVTIPVSDALDIVHCIIIRYCSDPNQI